MMFSLAGIISFKMMPQDRTKRYLVGKLGKNGITTYIPFFLASNYVPDMEPKKEKHS